MLKQENKQLSEQVQALTEECHALSAELREKKAHCQQMVLAVEAGMEQMRALNRMNYLELSARLKEALGLVSTYSEECDSMANRIDESMTDHTAQLKLVPVEAPFNENLEVLQKKSSAAVG